MRRTFWIIAVALLVLAAAPAKPPVVTVTKTDKTTIRGTLGDVTPQEVNLTTIPRSSTQPAQGEQVKIAWSDIKSVSNGLTQQKVIELWKRDHPDDACPDCHGEGKVVCPTCHGTGRDPAAAKDCPTCHGAETIPCTTPKCDKGKMPCPKQHLKLTEGTWYKKEDGTRWRKFPIRGGYAEVSEHHLGQIMEGRDGIPQPDQ